MSGETRVHDATPAVRRPELRPTRRQLLGGSAAALSSWWLAPALAAPGRAGDAALGDDRLAKAYQVRMEAAQRARKLGESAHASNGDEASLPRHLATFSKGLPHDPLGVVDAKAFAVLQRALESGKPHDFESIPLGGFVKLANPQASWSYDLVGVDASQLGMPPAPTFASAEQAGRDGRAVVARAAARRAVRRLGGLAAGGPGVRGPLAAVGLPGSEGGRGGHAGDALPGPRARATLAGPYLSQFLLGELPMLPVKIEQRIRTAVPGVDYLTDYDELAARPERRHRRGQPLRRAPRYIRNGRDLGEYVHRDFTYQSFLGACLMALRMGALPDGGNPYKHSRTQAPFTTFGQPFLVYLLAVVTQVALKTCWYQKWRVHRRLRPEEFGGRVEAHLRGTASYPLHERAARLGGAGRDAPAAGLGAARPGVPGRVPDPSVLPGGARGHRRGLRHRAQGLPGREARPPRAGRGGRRRPVAPAVEGGGAHRRRRARQAGRQHRHRPQLRRRALAQRRRRGAASLGEAVAIELLSEVTLTGNEMFEGFSLQRFDGQRVSVG